jgi:HK97 family phage major capsid protein
MNRLLQLRQAVADKDASLMAAKAAGKAALDAGQKLTDDQRQAVKGAQVDLDAAKADLADYESMLADERHAGSATQTAPKPTAPVHMLVTDRTEDDPKRGFRTSREFCLAVMQAFKSGMARMDPRLKPLATAGSDEQSSTSDPYGGFLMPIAFSPDVLSIQGEGDPTVPFTRKLPMDAPMVKINARVDKDHSSSVSGGLRVYRHSETSEIASSRAQTEQLSFDAHELMGLAVATESVLTDSPNAFIALISDGFRDEFAAKLLNEKLNGVGAGGQFLGVMNSPCKIAVAKEAGQTAATVVVANIDKMAARCWRYGSAIYLANHMTRPQLKGLTRAVGTGGSVVNYFTTDPNGQERLDGRPIFFTEFANVLGAEGDLILGNWSEFIEGLYQPLQQAESIHVRFVNHERAFKFWLRNAGMPWWRSALTPKKGDTLSPFVTLAVRS